MKKAVNYLSLFICSTLFMLSCQSLSLSNEESVQPKGRTFTCVFAQPDPSTKVDVNLSTGKTTWEVGDKILINAGSGGTSKRTVTLTAGDIFDGGKKATITIPGDLDPYVHKSGGVQDVTSTYYALYPADNVASGNLYYNQAFSNQNDFLMAACNVEDTFVFFNLCGVIAYTVNDGEDYDFDQVVFSGKDGETVAYDNYQARVWDKGSGAVVESYARSADTYKPLVPRTSCTNTVVSDGSTMNYIFLPGGTNFTTGFNFSFLSGGVIKKTASANAKKNVAPGKILKLGDISSHLQTYVPPSSHNASHPAIAGAEDLGETATANCYVVDGSVAENKDKVFKFKAVKGNSTTPVGDIADVVILWETWNNAETVTANSVVAEADYDKQDGDDDYWITFKMPATLHAGNAVIAAKNAGGDIVWSWHIWVPSSSVDVVDASAICGATLMDRNLGALEPVSTSTGASVYSLGMFYQWGRKDPFLGPKRAEDGAGYAIVAGTTPSVLKGSTMTISESIKNPTQYAASGISDMDLTKWSKTKSMYDPCPPGYKLPYMTRDDKPLSSTSSITSALEAAGLDWEASTTGFWFKAADGAKELVFPLAGYVEEGISSYYSYKNTLRGAIWYLCDSGSSPYHLNIRPAESTPSYVFGSTNLSRGCNVRCCVE